MRPVASHQQNTRRAGRMLPGSVGRLVPLIGRRREFGVQGGMKVYRGSAAAARNWLDEQTTGIVTGQWGRSPCWQADLEGVRREVAATAGSSPQHPNQRCDLRGVSCST